MKLVKLTALVLFIALSITSCRSDNEEDILVDSNPSIAKPFSKDSGVPLDNFYIIDQKGDTIRSGGHFGKIDSLNLLRN